MSREVFFPNQLVSNVTEESPTPQKAKESFVPNGQQIGTFVRAERHEQNQLKFWRHFWLSRIQPPHSTQTKHQHHHRNTKEQNKKITKERSQFATYLQICSVREEKAQK